MLMQQKGTEAMTVVPYRTAGELAPTKPTNTFGLLIAPKTVVEPEPKPHKCKLPNWFTRLLYRLKGKEITIGSLFRCGGCWKVYKWHLFDYSYYEWRELYGSDGNSYWKSLGGDVADKE